MNFWIKGNWERGVLGKREKEKSELNKMGKKEVWRREKIGVKKLGLSCAKLRPA